MGKKIAPEDRPLTKKQTAFYLNYLQNGWNATEAAKQAGYKGGRSQLAVIGHQNLIKLNIKKKIDEHFAIMSMSADEAIARVTKMARGFDITQYASTVETYAKDKKGNVYLSGYAVDIDMDRLQKDGHSHLVKRVYATKTGSIQIERYDEKAALELIGKNLKLWTDKMEVTDAEGNPIFPLTQIVRELQKIDKEKG